MAGESKASPRRIAVAERRGKALRLRAAGRTYDEITQALGYSTRSACIQDIQRALAATVAEPAAELRTLELERLDKALAVAFEVLTTRHLAHSNGRVVLHPETRQPLRDDGPRLNAIDRIVRVSESRRKLLGLDKQVLDVTVTEITQADIAFREMVAEQKARRAAAREVTQHDPATQQPAE